MPRSTSHDAPGEHPSADPSTGAAPVLAPVARIVRSLTAADDSREVMQCVADGALALTAARGAYVERISSARDEVEVVAVAGDGTPPLSARMGYPGSLTEAIIHGAGPAELVQLENIGESIAPYLAECCRGCSALVVPLISQEQALGALVLLRPPESEGFPPHEVAEAHTLGDLASLSLRRVLLLERAENERAHMAALLESTGEGIFGIDGAGRCTFINPAGARMLGYTPEACVGREMHAQIHHHRADGTPYPPAECPVQRALRTGQAMRVDDEVLWRRDGTAFPVEYAAYPIHDDGRVSGAVVTFLDVTEAKRAEAAERRYTTRVQALADAAVAIHAAPSLTAALQLITDRAREVIGAHQAVTSMTVDGDLAQAINAVSLSDKYARWRDYGDQPDGSGIYRRVAETNRPIRLTQAELEAHPAWRGFSEHASRHPPMRGWLAVPLVARDGGNIGLVQLSDRDHGEFTEQDEAVLVQFAQMAAVAIENARLYEEARAARGAAEAANRAKSEFLASMSHEIRTPINAVMGYTDLLDLGIAGPVTAGQRAHIERIRASSRHLIGLVDEILDLAKVESGRMGVESEHGLVLNAVADALSLVRPQAAEKGLEIRERCSDAGDVPYVGDERRVRQILVNLLSNAIKFTEAGTITVECGSTARPDPGADLAGEGRWTYVRVADTGIGIAPEEIEGVFRPFVQAERGYTRSQGGTGLGLSISRQLAQLMGGSLTVRSEPGRGSAFTLWLPSDSAAHPQVESAILAETRGEGEPPPGLAAVGHALQSAAPAILARYRERLRQDPRMPMAAELGEADLEDHMAPLLMDLGQSLIILEKGVVVPERLLRDGSEIQHLIAELHGRQRAQLGWTEDAFHREVQILREEVETGVRHGAAGEPDDAVDRGVALLRRFLDRAEKLGLRSLRRTRTLEAG